MGGTWGVYLKGFDRAGSRPTAETLENDDRKDNR